MIKMQIRKQFFKSKPDSNFQKRKHVCPINCSLLTQRVLIFVAIRAVERLIFLIALIARLIILIAR